MTSRWYVYMVSCRDGTLYTGITTEVERRVAEHNGRGKKGAKYTRVRRPVVLIYKKRCASRSDAAKKEYLLKHMTRKEKLTLIHRKKK